jgi:polyprenyl-phospho-N-acetylgalactosaminyl synthase
MNKQSDIFSKFEDDTWIVIPAYNEGESIDLVLEDFYDKNYSILVVDDCSQDNTMDVVLKHPITVLKHIINLGQGAALQTGFDYIIHNINAKYVITFDSDGQHDVSDIPKLLEPLINQGYGVVLGSRFLDKELLQNIPLTKWLVLKLGVLFTKLTTGLKVTDTHNGLRAFSIEALREIYITQDRMAHASEILSQISKKDLRWKEVPVTIHYTEYSKKKGQSIFNSLNILWDLFLGRD